jgi:ABC-type uncharacterized transport system ATPase subunit
MKLFEATDVRKTFGPLMAVADATLDIEMNEIAGLIGPNGSGKSTFLHTICGRTMPDSGSITLLGQELSRLSPTKRAKAGMAIKFQLARIYRDKTVEENLLLALQAKTSTPRLVLSRTRRTFDDKIIRLLQDFKLAEHGATVAGTLAHGQQQWLEIAMAMASDPKLLLLDEPTAGMSPKERQDTGLLIQAAAKTCGVLIVEHDLAFIRSLCDRITVLNQGKVVAVGTPQEIENDPRVQEVYLTRV